jgi:hypothetical protein
MADPVTFHRVEKEHLVRFGDGLVLSDMSNVDAAIRKHKLRGNGTLFWALISASSSAVRVPYGEGWGLQQRLNVKLGDAIIFVLNAHKLAPRIKHSIRLDEEIPLIEGLNP